MESSPEKQETIENIKAKVKAMQKNPVPSTYSPGSQQPGSTIKIGERIYRVVNLKGTIVRVTEKPLSSTLKHREQVALKKANLNPNLTKRLEREERLNKIRMFNKIQKDAEREATREKPQHPKVSITKPHQPKREVLASDIKLEMKKILEKNRKLKEKKKKARKHASLMRRLNNRNK